MGRRNVSRQRWFPTSLLVILSGGGLLRAQDPGAQEETPKAPATTEGTKPPKKDDKEGILLPVPSGPPRIPAYTRDPLDIELPPKFDGRNLRWTADRAEIIEEARRRNCPLMVVISSDDSDGFNMVWFNVFVQPDFHKLADRFLAVPAFSGSKHAKEDRDQDGKPVEDGAGKTGQEVEWCLIFDVPCQKHRDNYEIYFSTLIRREFWHPCMVFLEPEGKEISRVEGHMTTIERLKEELDYIEQVLGEPMSPKDYRARLEKLKKLADNRRRRGYLSTLNELDRLIKKNHFETAHFQAYAKKVLEAIIGEGTQQVEQAKSLVREGQVKEAQRILTSVVRHFRGYAPAETAQAVLDEI